MLEGVGVGKAGSLGGGTEDAMEGRGAIVVGTAGRLEGGEDCAPSAMTAGFGVEGIEACGSVGGITEAPGRDGNEGVVTGTE